MTGIHFLACLWTVLVTRPGFVHGDLRFLERHQGESVVLPCVTGPRNPSPYGVYLRRSWLQPRKVLFKLTQSAFTTGDDEDRRRISVSGDPSSHALNVTISQLRATDTDRYYCEFYINSPSAEDIQIPGNTEFFLLVTADVPGSVDIGLVETCAGGSAVLPCFPPNGEGLAVEGVSLQRQRGRAPVEVLYHSKHRHGSGRASSASSQFPTERVQLSSAPGPVGIAYNLTLQQLQPEDSAMYSCQLLVHGRPDTVTSLGRQVFFVSVQGDPCNCSTYSHLLYALSAAVAILLLLLLVGFVVTFKCTARHSVKPHPQAPIYEEMTGALPLSRKVAARHLEEMESSEYRNCPVKKFCPENHYESHSGAVSSRTSVSDMKY